jgi:hypothetical protein
MILGQFPQDCALSIDFCRNVLLVKCIVNQDNRLLTESPQCIQPAYAWISEFDDQPNKPVFISVDFILPVQGVNST